VRSHVLISESVDPTGTTLSFRIVLWVPVPAAIQAPNATATSIVPLANANGANKWGTDGITATELANLQSGAYQEIPVTMAFPLATFSDVQSASQIDGLYTNAVKTLAASVPPTGENYIGSSGQVAQVAAASNGASLPTGTISIATMPASAVPSSGVAFVVSSGGMQMISYTGTTGSPGAAGTLTGCTGGTGFLSTGANIWFFKGG
jgi:hypothetical protein